LGINIVARLLGLDSPRNDEDAMDKVVVDKKRQKRITKDWKVDFEDSVEKASEENEPE
tara:strand:+ start:461 stop:634 length:174 start_codon:yes stop_codon:yes gene_type:complete